MGLREGLYQGREDAHAAIPTSLHRDRIGIRRPLPTRALPMSGLKVAKGRRAGIPWRRL